LILNQPRLRVFLRSSDKSNLNLSWGLLKLKRREMLSTLSSWLTPKSRRIYSLRGKTLKTSSKSRSKNWKTTLTAKSTCCSSMSRSTINTKRCWGSWFWTKTLMKTWKTTSERRSRLRSYLCRRMSGRSQTWFRKVKSTQDWFLI